MVTVVLGSVGPVYDRGLAALLSGEDDLDVLAEGLGLAELEAAVVEHLPRVAVLSQRQLGEPLVLRRLGEIRPGIGLVVLASSRISEGLRLQLIALGAHACVSEHSPLIDLLTAVRYAAEGKGMWTPTGEEGGATKLGTGPPTRREREVIALVQRGLSTREIARELQISPGTVETHLKRIRRKLGSRRQWIPTT